MFSSGTKRKLLQACKQWQVQQNNWGRIFYKYAFFGKRRFPSVLWKKVGLGVEKIVKEELTLSRTGSGCV